MLNHDPKENAMNSVSRRSGLLVSADVDLDGPRVVHCKRERHHVYIGRPSKWGNPFVVGKHGTRAKVLWADAQGMYLLQRRLHRAVLVLPPPVSGSPSVQIDGNALAELLAGVPRIKKSHKKELH